MCFLPQDGEARELAIGQFEHFIRVEGQQLIGWRDVPIDTTGLGEAVLAEMPVIRQAFVGRGAACKDQDAFERKLLVIRKQTQNPLEELADKYGLPSLTDFYMPSFSTRTVVYKGLLLAHQVGTFYQRPDEPAGGVGAGAGAPAVLHQHLPVLAAGAPLPVHRPQRRDQHRARQRQLDERPPPHDGVGAAGAGPRQDVAADPARPVGHRRPRQRARAAAGRRLPAGPRDDDADPRGLGRQSADGSPSAAPSTSTTPR